MSDVVLDASALIALLMGEPGNTVVKAAMPGPVISSVNLAETVAYMVDRGAPVDRVRSMVAEAPVETIAFDSELAFTAGALRAATRRFGLSLGDRACLALAQRLNLPVLTADRQWARVDIGVEIRLIR